MGINKTQALQDLQKALLQINGSLLRLGINTEDKLLQLEKAPSPILVTVDGIVISFKLLQPINVLSLILVTEEGITIEVRVVQFEKAEVPISFTLEGISIDGTLEQPDKKCAGTEATRLPIVTDFNVGKFEKEPVGQSMA